nr:sugar ABC transporter ATP-binding protein [uncultured Oscillibacter sp.]
MSQEIVLEMKEISKRYPGVIALNNVSIDLRKGEVLGLLGENGAGKSTLMKILSGIIQPTSGKVYISGKKAEMKNINDAHSLGVSIIHQELNLINEMDAAQNMFLGREPRLFGNVIDKKKLYADTQQIMDGLGLQLDICTQVKNLSVARRQMVEIGKALSYDANIIIMDEPTAPLTNVEINELFRIIRRLKEEGRSVIYISHRLEEIPVICDRASVLRDGCFVGTENVDSLDRETMINMMAGRVLKDLFPKIEAVIGGTALEVKGLNAGMLRDISFSVRRGEIVALTGLVGAGRTETARALFGVDRKESGDIYIDGKRVEIHQPQDAIRCGLAFLTEDRKDEGFVPLMSVKENITLPNLAPVQRCMVIDKAKEMKVVNRYIESLRIKTPHIGQQVKFLSGGNQQKVVLAKWLNLNADILILDEPTRGIDVGAKAEIYTIMGEAAKQGKAIIMISSEMEEVMAVSDRAVIMCEGRITGTLERKDYSQEKIMSYAMGGT